MQLYPSLTWQMDKANKSLYLTFDDGPIPEVTPFVLRQLKAYDARATFFCVGHNIEKHPNEFDQILEAQHSIGNHTFHHVNGWNTNTKHYLDNVQKCQDEMEKHTGKLPVRLFRPPHGKISRNQIRSIKKTHEIVMWSYLTGDFDMFLSKEKCLERAIKKVSSNDIVVLHDSIKSYSSLAHTLPAILRYFSDLGFTFEAIGH